MSLLRPGKSYKENEDMLSWLVVLDDSVEHVDCKICKTMICLCIVP